MPLPKRRMGDHEDRELVKEQFRIGKPLDTIILDKICLSRARSCITITGWISLQEGSNGSG